MKSHNNFMNEEEPFEPATVNLHATSKHPSSTAAVKTDNSKVTCGRIIEEEVFELTLPISTGFLTASATTDDLPKKEAEHAVTTTNDDLQVTATIRIKTKNFTFNTINNDNSSNMVKTCGLYDKSLPILKTGSPRNENGQINDMQKYPYELQNNPNGESMNKICLSEEKKNQITSNDLDRSDNDYEFQKSKGIINTENVKTHERNYPYGKKNGVEEPRESTPNEIKSGSSQCLLFDVDLNETSVVSPSRHSTSDHSSVSSPLSVLSNIGNENRSEAADYGRNRKEGVCGLRNIGNTCFMNSIIQCLSHTRDLTAFLRSQPLSERGSSKDHRILAEYTKLIKDMWSGIQPSISPSDLKHAVSSKHRMYSGSAQHDAQEFLRFFLDALHSALNVSVKREPLGEIDDAMDNRVKADMLWEWYSKAENSVIKDLFVGQLRSTLKCTYCNTESTMFDPFWDLSLPLPSSNSRCKLETCLQMFIKEEILDDIDQPTCSQCKARRRCTKSLTIERFPKYLVIHLKRFSETRWNKLTNIVDFPTGIRELNLQPYASENNTGPVYYSLYGISNHMGSMAGGHYVAVCKNSLTQQWKEFNDNFVSDLPEKSLVTSSAYVLFYERS